MTRVAVASEGLCSITTDATSNKTYCTNSAIIIQVKSLYLSVYNIQSAQQCNSSIDLRVATARETQCLASSDKTSRLHRFSKGKP